MYNILCLITLNFLLRNSVQHKERLFMDIGSKLKRLRVLAGLTQEELADRAELSKGFISQLENNITSPSIATLLDILQCLGVQIKDFFDETKAIIIITHHKEILKNVKADYVHVLKDGELIRTSDATLIDKIEENGYENISNL